MNRFFTQYRSIVLIGLMAQAVVFAKPIENSVVNAYKAGWFPSSAVPCPIVCKQQDSAFAEREMFSIPSLSNKLTYVCKGKTATGGAYAGSGFLFGNNFESPARNKVCMVSTADGSVVRLSKFYCLCVY